MEEYKDPYDMSDSEVEALVRTWDENVHEASG
jgi:hypothetical protein